MQEVLLAFSYSPDNFYCYSMDVKSNQSFKNDLKIMASCLPNVFVSPYEYKFSSAGHYQNDAHHQCTKELLQYPGWKYVLYLQVSFHMEKESCSERRSAYQNERRNLKNHWSSSWTSYSPKQCSTSLSNT